MQANPLLHSALLVHLQMLSTQVGVGWLQAPQSRWPPQPSGYSPQFLWAGQDVNGVQPHTLAAPPPPQVWGGVQTAQAPLLPQAAFAVPFAQEPSLAQHWPSGQRLVAEQIVQTSPTHRGAAPGQVATHEPLLTSQQVSAGQSAGLAAQEEQAPLTHSGFEPEHWA